MKKTKLKKQLKTEFYMTAHVYDDKATRISVRVPVAVSSVPEVPEIIFKDKWAAVLISTEPLAYRSVVFGKAKDL